MAQQQWEVEPAVGRCAVTGRALEEGEEFYSALFEDGESFKRVDYCLDSWEKPPEGAYCHFKSRVPVKEKKKRLLVNNDVLVSFFTRLEEETEVVRVQFRFVIALMLMRKRLLRYDRSVVEDDAEVWEMTLTRDHSTHRVVNPRLTDEQIEGVSKQLSAILHEDMGEWALGDSDTEATDVDTSRPDDEPL
ncbi:MAG: hypothetical protein JSU63_00340 [Phycisphaerales bacterium]|nr:MAG: hypothetical protein JSU63_00340 [Phycisphaerales bacterium]